MWVNVGEQQFHLPRGAAQKWRGHIGFVVPSLQQLRRTARADLSAAAQGHAFRVSGARRPRGGDLSVGQPVPMLRARRIRHEPRHSRTWRCDVPAGTTPTASRVSTVACSVRRAADAGARRKSDGLPAGALSRDDERDSRLRRAPHRDLRRELFDATRVARDEQPDHRRVGRAPVPLHRDRRSGHRSAPHRARARGAGACIIRCSTGRS